MKVEVLRDIVKNRVEEVPDSFPNHQCFKELLNRASSNDKSLKARLNDVVNDIDDYIMLLNLFSYEDYRFIVGEDNLSFYGMSAGSRDFIDLIKSAIDNNVESVDLMYKSDAFDMYIEKHKIDSNSQSNRNIDMVLLSSDFIESLNHSIKRGEKEVKDLFEEYKVFACKLRDVLRSKLNSDNNDKKYFLYCDSWFGNFPGIKIFFDKDSFVFSIGFEMYEADFEPGVRNSGCISTELEDNQFTFVDYYGNEMRSSSVVLYKNGVWERDYRYELKDYLIKENKETYQYCCEIRKIRDKNVKDCGYFDEIISDGHFFIKSGDSTIFSGEKQLKDLKQNDLEPNDEMNLSSLSAAVAEIDKS